jgi:hypothetical protein
MTTITREQWEAKGAELFGPDNTKWRFVCPACGKELSIESVRAELAEHLPVLREKRFALEQECVGRYVPGVGCNWVAYGLFSGPLFVTDGEKKTPAFDFAGKPFTARAP